MPWVARRTLNSIHATGINRDSMAMKRTWRSVSFLGDSGMDLVCLPEISNNYTCGGRVVSFSSITTVFVQRSCQG